MPEAQLDRFLVRIDLDYPRRETERAILLATTGAEEAETSQAMSAEDLRAAQALLRRMPVGEALLEAILDLVRACRPEDESASADLRAALAWGPGPRAAQALMLLVRARALLKGRMVPDLDDLRAMAVPALQHRMALSFEARAEGLCLPDVIGAALDAVCGRA